MSRVDVVSELICYAVRVHGSFIPVFPWEQLSPTGYQTKSAQEVLEAKIHPAAAIELGEKALVLSNPMFR